MKKRRVITALFFMYIIVFRTYDAILSLSLNLSLIMAMNSELVGLPRSLWTVYPKYELSTSTSPRSHATSMAWRMARSTLDEVVEYFFRDGWVENLGHRIDNAGVLDRHYNGVAQIMISLYVSRYADLMYYFGYHKFKISVGHRGVVCDDNA